MMRLRCAGAAALVLLAVGGCAGGKGEPSIPTAASGTPAASSPTGSSDAVTTYIEAVRSYVACMRAAGFDYTDPDSKGQFTPRGAQPATKTDPKFLAAGTKCAPLLLPMPRELQYTYPPEQVKVFQQYAKCMQSHGAPDYPDPDPEGYSSGTMWVPGTDAAQRALRECGSIIGEPSNPPPAQG